MYMDVTMSSLYNPQIYHAGSFAVDGQVLNRPGADTCATTEPEVKPWLSIDFGNTYDIDRVVIYKRDNVNIGYTRHIVKTNRTQKNPPQHRILKTMKNQW